eukprot:TRINITY_DN50147_c0_g1_i1.p1 TRINITY_DN50147_c0_g1~~TRINITY_DN50147_c0_g1_i1.p1  ORF type:complete len:619 (+),score=232.87 TRINITY_DN50147_c0_g1_i1:84-1859(+)
MPLFGRQPVADVAGVSLPSAHRRPKFRLEEMSRPLLLAAALGALLLFGGVLVLAALAGPDVLHDPKYVGKDTATPLKFFHFAQQAFEEGDIVVRVDNQSTVESDSDGNPGVWQLAAGESATVVSVDADGNLRLENAQGATSALQRKEFYSHKEQAGHLVGESFFPTQPEDVVELVLKNKYLTFELLFERSEHAAQVAGFEVALSLSITVMEPRPEDATNPWAQLTTQSKPSYKRLLVCRRGRKVCTLNKPVIHLPGIPKDGFRCSVRVQVVEMDVKDHAVFSFVANVLTSMEGKYEWVNWDFAWFELYWRYAFFAVNLIITLLFHMCIYRLGYPWKAWALEQKWTMILLVCLLGFNNPMSALEVYSGDVFWHLLNTALLNTYLVVFLFALLAFTDHVAQTKKKTTLAFYGPKAALLGLLWAVAVFSWARGGYQQHWDPAASSGFDVEMDGYEVLKIFVGVIIGIYGLWLLYLVVTVLFRDTRPAVHVSLRFKVVWSLTFLMVAAIIAGLLRVRVWDTSGSIEFLLFYAIFNIYTFMLALFFSPATDAMPFRAVMNAAQAAQVSQRAREFDRVQLTDDDGTNQPCEAVDGDY